MNIHQLKLAQELLHSQGNPELLNSNPHGEPIETLDKAPQAWLSCRTQKPQMRQGFAYLWPLRSSKASL